MRQIFTISLLFLAWVMSAQTKSPIKTISLSVSNFTIQGVVKDSLANSTIQGVTVSFYLKGNNNPIQGVLTDQDGVFSWSTNAKIDYVKFTFIGYKENIIQLTKRQMGDKIINLGVVSLKSTGIHLNAVTVTTTAPEMVVKEDTIEYNASAFRVSQNAVVEDLLKRLPGVEVDKNGNITTTSGKSVSRVYVDGKRFFGDDPKMATRNLSADIVDKVQVVDKKSDLAQLTGVDDDDSETVINITIKKGMKKGWIGRLNNGLGKFIENNESNAARYNISTMLNRFRESSQLSFLINANNVNNRTSTDRGNSVRSGGGGVGGANGGGNSITTSNNFGVNWAKDFGDKFKAETSASYNYSDDFTKSNSFSEYIQVPTTATKYNKSASQNHSYSNNFAAEGRFEYTPDKLTTFRLGTNFSYNSSKSNSLSNQSSLRGDADSTLVNTSNANNRLNSNGTQIQIQLDASRKLSNMGRQLSFSGTVGTNHSGGNGIIDSKTLYYIGSTPDEIRDQHAHSNSNRNSFGLRTDYVEPLSKNTFLNFSYNVQFNNTYNERLTYDKDTVTGNYDILNAKYSRNSETNTVNQNLRAAFRGIYSKYTYSFGLNVAPVHTKSKTYVKDWFGVGQDSVLNVYKGKTTFNFAPQLDFVYRFDAGVKKSANDSTLSKGSYSSGMGQRAMRGFGGGSRNSLRVRYDGQMQQPSVTQLDPTPNNNNPLNITYGNPDLLPTFTHRITSEYSKFNVNNQSSINARVILSYVRNDIVSYTTYIDSTGGQTTKPVNVNGSWNTTWSLMWAKPFGKDNQFRFSTQSRASYQNLVGFTKVDSTSVKNTTKNLGLMQGANLSYTNDWFYGQLRAQMTYTNIRYTAGSAQTQNSYNYSFTYNTQITMPYSFSFSSDISWTFNRGLTAGYNKNEVLWNAELGKTVFGKGYLSFKMTDILRQKLNVSRSISSKAITDTQFTALTSYAMVSFSYRFSNVGGRNRNWDRNGNRDMYNMSPGGGDMADK